MLTLYEKESVSEAWLGYGVEEARFEMGAEEFAVKVKTVLVRSTSVAEVVRWMSSETVGENRSSEMTLESSLLSICSSCSLLLTTRAWTSPFNKIVDLRFLMSLLLKSASLRGHHSFRSSFWIALS